MLFQISKVHNFVGQYCLGAAVAVVLGASGANAQDNAVLFTGLDGYKNNSGAYIGFVYALNGDINASGWTVASSLSYAISKDNSGTPTVTTDSIGAVVTLGYQWDKPDYFLSLALGVDVIDNDDSPSIGSITEGRKAGAVAQIGFETKATNALYFNGFGEYHTANKRSYVQLRAGYKSNGYTYGLEGVYAKELDSQASTILGVFVNGIEFGKGTLGFSVGVLNGRDNDVYDGAHVAVEYSMPLRF